MTSPIIYRSETSAQNVGGSATETPEPVLSMVNWATISVRYPLPT